MELNWPSATTTPFFHEEFKGPNQRRTVGHPGAQWSEKADLIAKRGNDTP